MQCRLLCTPAPWLTAIVSQARQLDCAVVHCKIVTLTDRLKELEAAAEQLQAALLAELDAPSNAGSTGSKKKSKAKKGKKKQVGSLYSCNICFALCGMCLHPIESLQSHL